MADEDDGATPAELLLEACRRNNSSLLQTVISSYGVPPPPPSSSSSSTSAPPQQKTLASLLNTTLDPLGRTALHICAAGGADETLDLLLDQEGLEVEPRERHGGDTPLHCAVRYVIDAAAAAAAAGGGKRRDNDDAPDKIPEEAEEEDALMVKELMGGVELLLDAGADPRIRNEAGRGVKPEGLLVGANGKGLGLLREVLAKWESDLVVREHLGREMGDGAGEEEDDGGPTGSQSDSD